MAKKEKEKPKEENKEKTWGEARLEFIAEQKKKAKKKQCQQDR